MKQLATHPGHPKGIERMGRGKVAATDAESVTWCDPAQVICQCTRWQVWAERAQGCFKMSRFTQAISKPDFTMEYAHALQ